MEFSFYKGTAINKGGAMPYIDPCTATTYFTAAALANRVDNISEMTTMFASSGSKEGATMWREGSLKVHDSIFHYWMKQYDDGSQFGIEGGGISKLMLKRNGTIVCSYDRGWDFEPVDPDTRLALEILLHGENQ